MGLHLLKNEKVSDQKGPESLNVEKAREILDFHKKVEGYQRTNLVSLDALAKELGVKAIYVKDEASRFGLKAFKGLGGIYALSCVICEKLGLDIRKTAFSDLRQPERLEKLSGMVFATATDGNHGKGVAWASGLLGCESHIFMPAGSSEYRAQAIRDAGRAEVVITEWNYDDTVRYVKKLARERGWILIQDTAVPGYEQVPQWITQGYLTMAYEAAEQIDQRQETPTHVFLQAGVGSMAAAVTGFLVNCYEQCRPVITVVEPEEAACIYESVKRGDGAPHGAVGNGHTIMAGLNCGEPSLLAWPVLRDFCSCYLTIPDEAARKAMRLMAHPRGADPAIISGESGASVMGAVLELLSNSEYAPWKREMGLNEQSVILLFNTEGDTDPESYRRILK